VAAAGNTGGATQCPQQRPDASWETATVAVSPAWYDDYVLTVGSVNSQGAPSAFTLAGPWVDVAAVGEAATSLGSAPISGTSYAAPVVAGVAALIRARFPALTARQVMQRIESTAHHPPAGWDALVGHGTVDALAAVSTDVTPATNTSTSSPTSAPITPPATPRPPDPRARNTAFGGAAGCLVALLTALTIGAAKGRLRPPGNGVAGD
jgi:membrane-anchored mycosin MYCP